MKLMICICWLSFYFQGYCQFVRYQTFDEYKMEGITNKRIRRPCVFIKWESDTIFVIKSNDKDNVIKYINCGSYWHAVIQIKEPCSCMGMDKRICEKFIYNDTVVEYEYILKPNNKRSAQTIAVNTKDKCLFLSLKSNEIDNKIAPFDEIMEIINKYKNNSYSYPPMCPPEIFEKQIEKNIFSVYLIKEGERKLIKSRKINHLGEFNNRGSLVWW